MSAPPSSDSSSPIERRLAAIVFTDIVGYSARMQVNEADTVAKVRDDFARISAVCVAHSGEVLNTMGDGMLLSFGSAVQAVTCALQLQGEFAARNTALNTDPARESGLQHRIGIHLGDVIRQEGGGVAGDGVNIASRLESKAPPGGICVSESIYQTVRGKVPMREVLVGPVTLKNIATPITTYHLFPVATDVGTEVNAISPANAPARGKKLRVLLLWAGVIAALVAIFAGGWWLIANRATPQEKDSANAKSIAVLPFENMSEDKDKLFFAEGVHEDLLTQLSHIRDLRVVSRTSVMQYRGTTKSMRQIGQELGVAYLLEGSVRRIGNKVRVTGQLIRASKDEHVWAKNYDRELTDIFAIQAALAQEIAGSLKVAISPEERSSLERRSTESLAAYDLFLEARQLANQDPSSFSFDTIEKRRGLLKRAVELDPQFALAWAELAVAHANYTFQGFVGGEQSLAAALDAIDTAVRLAPEMPEIIGARGRFLYYGFQDFAGAQEEFTRLIRINPQDAMAHFWLGLLQRRQGRWLDAVANMKKAAQLEQGNILVSNSLAETLELGRRFDEAIVERKRTLGLLSTDPKGPSTLAWLAFRKSGSTREMDEWFSSLPKEHRDSPKVRSLGSAWALVTGNLAEYQRLDSDHESYDDGFLDRSVIGLELEAAMLLAANGDRTGALRRLKPLMDEWRQRRSFELGNSRLFADLSYAEAIAGNKSDAVRFSKRAVELMPVTRDALYGVDAIESRAFVQAWTGDKKGAIKSLASLLRTPGFLGDVHQMRTSARYAPLKGDPRFEALLNDPANQAPLF
ncbi:MAG: hypothetical protein JNJ55_07515 [Betaproteobacteria bacterium]|nr:hypothetical protein [Betaproteobacteria bacterium]